MANILPIEKQVMAIGALAEGTSIRSIERMMGVHRDTIMRLGVRVGTACEKVMDSQMRNLDCKQVQVDELWGFIGKKQKQVTAEDAGAFVGDVWTYVAIDAETKLVPAYSVGKREYVHTSAFLQDVASRMKNRIQLSTDGLDHYLPAVEDAFGANVDYGQIVKVFASPQGIDRRRYSAPEVISTTRKSLMGEPDDRCISTSYVERQNLTLRMHCRRLARLTNAFSKKIENFRAAIGLHFAYYNYVKMHSSIRCTPAMAAGVSSRLWTVKDIVELAA